MRKSEAINDIKDIKNYAGKEAECEDTTVSEPVPCYAGPSIMEDMHASAFPLDLLRQVCEVSLKEYHEGHCSTHDELDAYIKERMGWK